MPILLSIVIKGPRPKYLSLVYKDCLNIPGKSLPVEGCEGTGKVFWYDSGYNAATSACPAFPTLLLWTVEGYTSHSITWCPGILIGFILISLDNHLYNLNEYLGFFDSGKFSSECGNVIFKLF